MFSAQKFSCFACTFILVFVLCLGFQKSYAQEAAKTDTSKTDQKAAGGSELGNKELGQQLFGQYCQSCHGVTDEVVVGPGLKGILTRREVPWLLKWVRNSQEVIKSGDAYAVALYAKFNQSQMQSFPNFKDEDIKNILAYIEDAGKKGPVNAGGPDSTAVKGNDKAGAGDSNYLTIVLGVLMFVLVLILGVLVVLISALTKYLKQRESSGDLEEEDAEVLNQKFDITKILQSRVFIGSLVLIFTLVVAKAGLDELVNIGVQQGYAPTQPIAFSHKLHAGTYEIDCNYCHTGVSKGKSATIPSANICMNCHNAIKRESPEIKKIYAAIENDKPIEWVRIHNLQDFVYFNHSQHVVAGQLECTSCHGEVKEMEVVQQRSTLTMGWCIDCHRQTVVKAEGNAYYDKLLTSHNEYSNKPMKVQDIGGLECSKCHY